jgi:hypothetical protein
MRNFAKWLLIVWSLLCLIGIYFGFTEFSYSSKKVVPGIGGEELGINAIVTIFAGLLLYLIVAMPALLIWLLLDRRENQVVDHLHYYDLEKDDEFQGLYDLDKEVSFFQPEPEEEEQGELFPTDRQYENSVAEAEYDDSEVGQLKSRIAMLEQENLQLKQMLHKRNQIISQFKSSVRSGR